MGAADRNPCSAGLAAQQKPSSRLPAEMWEAVTVDAPEADMAATPISGGRRHRPLRDCRQSFASLPFWQLVEERPHKEVGGGPGISVAAVTESLPRVAAVTKRSGPTGD